VFRPHFGRSIWISVHSDTKSARICEELGEFDIELSGNNDETVIL
jgi:hypothetical protein